MSFWEIVLLLAIIFGIIGCDVNLGPDVDTSSGISYEN